MVKHIDVMLYCLCVFARAACATDALQPDESSPAVSTPLMDVRFSAGGDILSIDARYHNGNHEPINGMFHNADATPFLTVAGCQTGPAAYSLLKTDTSTTIRFRTNTATITYVLHNDRYIIDAVLSCGSAMAAISSGLDGRGGGSVRMSARIAGEDSGDCRHIGIDKKSGVHDVRGKGQPPMPRYDWYGVRNRFWAVIIKSADVNVSADFSKGIVTFPSPDGHAATAKYTLYAGPVEYRELKKAGHECTKLLYPLWFWMRWLTLGMWFIFNWLLEAFKDTGVAIIGLSVCVKVIIAPLFRVADKWQRRVNEQKSLLAPYLDEVKKKYKGEEQTKQTLAVYRQHNISPLYTLKSLLSVAIQIPFFFAAYHLLSEHIALQGVALMWIDDLSHPDGLLPLPLTLPFFGSAINILPFLMTGITLAASCIHSDRSLSPALQRSQRNSLYIVALLFFVLLYTSPAGLLLYWIMNNAISLFSNVVEWAKNERNGKRGINS